MKKDKTTLSITAPITDAAKPVVRELSDAELEQVTGGTGRLDRRPQESNENGDINQF